MQSWSTLQARCCSASRTLGEGLRSGGPPRQVAEHLVHSECGPGARDDSQSRPGERAAEPRSRCASTSRSSYGTTTPAESCSLGVHRCAAHTIGLSGCSGWSSGRERRDVGGDDPAPTSDVAHCGHVGLGEVITLEEEGARRGGGHWRRPGSRRSSAQPDGDPCRSAATRRAPLGRGLSRRGPLHRSPRRPGDRGRGSRPAPAGPPQRSRPRPGWPLRRWQVSACSVLSRISASGSPSTTATNAELSTQITWAVHRRHSRGSLPRAGPPGHCGLGHG